MRGKRREKMRLREQENAERWALIRERNKHLPPLEDGEIRYTPGQDYGLRQQPDAHEQMLERARRKQKWKEEKRKRLLHSTFMSNSAVPLRWKLRRIDKWVKRGLIRTL